jgi:hypothetical protein
MNSKALKIDALHERHPGLTPSLAGVLEEAACVCLSRYHTSPVLLDLRYAAREEQLALPFQEPTARTRRAHANEIDTTELGAYGVSIATLEAVAGLVTVSRAETLTGADWYVAPSGAPVDDLEQCLRLEVSGIGRGPISSIASRLREKLAQAARGHSNLPALASVVGFEAHAIAISRLGAHE